MRRLHSKLGYFLGRPGASLRLLVACSALTGAALAQEAALDAADQATIGSAVDVRWTGPGNQYDSVYVILPSAGDDAKGINSGSITSGKNPVRVVMPDDPGEYELRYWDRKAGKILVRRPIRVVDVPTEIAAPDAAQMGAKIEIGWQGPGNSYEFIGLYESGAADDAKSLAAATVLGRSPIVMHLPETPGQFELRYVTRQSKRVLARRPLVIEGVEATLEAPDTADVGSTIEIHWTGPGNQYDQLALYPAGAEEGAKPARSEGIVSKRNPVPMRLPEQAGAYELRYVTRKNGIVLATRPIAVGGVDAALDAPERATAGTPIDVGWTGPGNDYDLIALYPEGAEDGAKAAATATILSAKNPVLLNLPDEAGPYELRYRTAQQGTVLARRAITVEPGGRLAVVFERDGEIVQTSGDGAVEIILDASGSMLQREDGTRRIEIARGVLDELVRDQLDDQRLFALRVFGHKEAGSCRTDIEIPLGPLDRDAAATRIASVNAMNLAKTPIADSLAKVPTDLAGADGPKTVILITDGEETCEGDPAAVIRDLRARGLDVQVSIVGFAIDDPELKEDFQSWAELGGGQYFDARSANELTRSLRTVISGPFRVLDAAGKVVGKGVIGGAEIVLPAGTYKVETVGGSPQIIDDVVIKPDELTKVAF